MAGKNHGQPGSCAVVVFLLMPHALIPQHNKLGRMAGKGKETQTSLSPCSFSSCSPQSAEEGDRLAMNQELNKKFVCTAPLGSMRSREAMRGEAVGLRDSAWELNPHGLVFKTKTAQCQGKNPNDFFFNFS